MNRYASCPSRFSRGTIPVAILGLSLFLLAGCAGTGTGAKVEETHPSAEAILDGYVQASGGLEAYARIENQVSRGTFEIAQQGLKGSLTIYHARPNQMYTRLELAGLGTVESGISGDIVWENSVATGPRIKQGQEKADALREATFDKFARWREIYPEVEYARTENVAGKPCHAVMLKPESGQPLTLYFDRETYLVSKVVAVAETQMGTIPTESYPGDYREVAGLLLPHSNRVKVITQERLISIESVEHNTALPAGVFDMPPEIQALVDQQEQP